MKIKTSELIGAALDWAVAKCEGHLEGGWLAVVQVFKKEVLYTIQHDSSGDAVPWSPSTNWSQGGPIIERERIEVGPTKERWYANAVWAPVMYADIPLIAAMRCYVASKLGDEVDAPEELE